MFFVFFLFFAASHICTEPDRLSIMETFSTCNKASGHAFSAVDFSNQNWHTLTFWTTAPPPKKKGWVGYSYYWDIDINEGVSICPKDQQEPSNGRVNGPARRKGVLGSSKWRQWLEGSGSLGWMTYPLLTAGIPMRFPPKENLQKAQVDHLPGWKKKMWKKTW